MQRLQRVTTGMFSRFHFTTMKCALLLLVSIATLSFFGYSQVQDTLKSPLRAVCFGKGQWGLSDSNQVVVAAIYDKIQDFPYPNNLDHVDGFFAYKKDSVHVYNRYGQYMCAIKTEEIERGKLKDAQGKSTTIYGLSRGRGLSYREGMALEDGTVTLPIKYRLMENEQGYDFFLQKARTGNRNVLINALTGAKSKEHAWIVVDEKGGIFYDGKKSGVLDENMKVIHTENRYGLSRRMTAAHPTELDYINIEDYSFYYNNPIYYYYSGWEFLREGPVYMRVQYGETEGRKGYVRLKTDPKFGLVNIQNKRELPVVYDFIYSMKTEHDDTLICIRNSEDPVLEIYDYELNRIQSFSIDPNWFQLNNTHVFTTSWYGTRRFPIKKANGKIGITNMRGETLIPFDFDGYYVFSQGHHANGFIGFAMRKNGKYGLYDIDGKQIVPNEYDTLTQYNNYFLGQKGEELTVFNASWEKITDRVTSFQYDNAMNYMGQQFPNERVAYCTKDGQLFVIENDQLVRQDDTQLLFEADEKVVLNQFKIDRQGKVLETDSRKFGLRSADDYVAVPRKTTKKHTESLVSYEETGQWEAVFREGSYVKYTDHNGAQGIFDINTQEWLIAPGSYHGIFPILDEKQKIIKGYWVQFTNDRKRNANDWYVLKEDLSLALDVPFEFPNPVAQDYIIVQQKAKFGLLNASYDLILPCSYEHIYQYDNHVLVLHQGRWYFFDATNGLSENSFDAVDTRFYTKGNFVFEGDSIGFANRKGEMLIPFSLESDLVENYDLFEFLEEKPFATRNKCTEAQRKFNNKVLLKQSRGRNSDHNFMETYFASKTRRRKGIELPVPAIWLRNATNMCYYSVGYQFQGYFSLVETEIRYRWKDGYHVHQFYRKSGEVSKKFTTTVYRCEGGTLIPITLKDLLIADGTAEPKLDQLLLARMEPFVKSYNATPEDVQRMLNEMKQTFALQNNHTYCFYINDSKLSAGGTPVDKILVRFYELEGICKPMYVSQE